MMLYFTTYLLNTINKFLDVNNWGHCTLHDEYIPADAIGLINSKIVHTLDSGKSDVETVHRTYITF